MQIKDRKITKRDLVVFGLGIGLIFLLWSVYMLGAVMSCGNGGGGLANINDPTSIACLESMTIPEYLIANGFFQYDYEIDYNVSGVNP